MSRETERVVKAITESGFKQRFLAEKMGIGEQKLTAIIKGRRMMNTDEMVKLCGVLRTDPNTLLGYNEAK